MGTVFIKSSILLFYLRFPSEKRFRIVTYMVLFVVVFYSLFGAFTFLLMCRPVKKYWNPAVPGTCLNVKAAFLVTGVFNVVTDFIILSLPIWLLRPLRLPRKQKILVTLILMTGSL
jgi:Fungal rhodopsin domain